MGRKTILAISGSLSAGSANLKLINYLKELMKDRFDLNLFEGVSELPHFNPDLDTDSPPGVIVSFRKQLEEADGLLICTPEYVFSLPGSLKNAIEWCVSTTILSGKSSWLITASASGEKAHEELKLIMKTVEAKFTEETTLLIKGIKGKFDKQGNLTDTETIDKLNRFITAFNHLY